MANDYPLALYRPGDEFEWEGRKLAMTTVADEAEHKLASGEGWLSIAAIDAPDPLDHDGDGRKGGSLPKAKRRGK